VHHDQCKLAQNYIHNLAGVHLDSHTTIALGKNPKFVPLPPAKTAKEISSDFSRLARSMRLRYLHQESDQARQNKFKCTSTFEPGLTDSVDLENYLYHTENELRTMMGNYNPSTSTEPHMVAQKSNIDGRELAALKKLSKNQKVVVKRCDKGSGIVLCSRQQYIQAADTQHQDGVHYEYVSKDTTRSTAALVRDTLTRLLKSKEISPQTHKYLSPDMSTIRTPEFYQLPKIHKPHPPIKTRPIISACSGPCERISEFVDYFLIEIVKKQSTYIRDTTDILNKLSSIYMPSRTILIAGDIRDMYTNILHGDAINIVKGALESNKDIIYEIPRPKTESLLELVSLILSTNTFHFNGKYIKQTVGLAMGSKASCSISDITVHPFEQKLILANSTKILSWYRFRDDILILWTGTENELQMFFKQANSMHPTLKFTFEHSIQEVNFLDLTIYKGKNFKANGHLDTKVHTKPTDTFMYLEPTSAHPKHVFKSLIIGETIRYIRNSSHESDFRTKLEHFTKHLTIRGHSRPTITKHTGTKKHTQRNSLLTPKNTSKNKKGHFNTPLVMVTSFDPRIKNLKKALTRHWNMIQTNAELSSIFPEPPILAHKRGRNLSDIIIKSRLSPIK
jgi:hypothetical protein